MKLRPIAQDVRRAIRGAGGGGKGGGGGARTPVESPDSLRSRAYARVLDVLCEGEIEGLVNGLQSVYLDETPLQNADGTFNFQGVTLVTRAGTQGQTYIPGFASVEAETAVGVAVTQGTPVVRSITNADADAVRVRVSIPALYSVDSGSGDTRGTSVQYGIDLQAYGGGYVAQILGSEYLAGSIAAGAGTVPATTAIQGTVQWQRPTIIDEVSEHIDYDGTSFEGVIEYQPASGGAWTTIKTISGSGKADGSLGGSGGFRGLTGSTGFGFDVSGLTSLAYNVRARVTSGTGSLPISQIAYLTTTTTVTVTGKASSKYERSHRIELTGTPPWDIRVRRITADSGTSLLANATSWESYTEITDTKLSYPNSALAGLVVDSGQFRSVPRRGYHLRLLRVQVPQNYDPVARTYTGVWDGTFKTAWTNNPAWVFYDLVTNARYGLGQFLDAAQVDKWALYTIARYCDELVADGLGGEEPRFTCNVYLQTREEAFRVLNDLASAFRGMIYWGSGAVTAVQDSPADPAMIFSAANVVDGVFSYSGSSLKSRHTVAIVGWNDPDDFYRIKREYVEDADGIALYGVVQTEVVAVGCTSRGQAHRVGRWLLYSERLEGETVNFKTGLEGNICRPGQVIKVADPTRAGVRRGGRVLTGATTTSIPLDASVTLGAGAYTLLVVEPDGTVTERAVSTGAGTHSTLTIAALPNAPQLHAMWLLRDDTVEAQTFRVIAAVETARHEIEVTALAHNVSKFAAIEDGLALVTPDISDIKAQPDAPAAVSIDEQLYEYQAEVLVLVSISWEPVERVGGYTLWWRRDNGNWNVITELKVTEYEIPAAQPGTYDVRVQAVNTLGIASVFTEESQAVLGKTAAPSDVVTFTAQQNNNVVIFKWSQIPDVDLAGYEIRYSARSVSDWDTATPVTSVTKGTQVTTAAVPPGSWAFLIKAVDTSGVYSANATRYDLEVLSDLQVIQTDTYNPAWLGWAEAGNGLMWGTATDLLWDQGSTMWAADPASLMWSATASTPMWADTELMWTQSHFVRHWTGVLVPTSKSLASDFDFEVFDQFVPNPWEICYYDGVEVDQDFDAQARVFATIGAALGPGETTGVADPDLYLDYRTEAGAYDGLEPWTIGSIVGRYVLPRIVLDTTKGVAKITEFTVTLDAEDSAQGAHGVAVAAAGTAIVFSPQYHATPRLQVSAAADGGAARYATWESLTAAGFTARVFNAAGTDIGGTINWESIGV